jgi:ribonuclease VapC
LKGVKVLDSWALLALFEGQSAGKKVLDLLQKSADHKQTLLISVVNWGEVLYIVESRHRKEKKEEVERLMAQMPLEVVVADQTTARVAAELKANHKLPYADCFAAALTYLQKAVLVTGDKDFRVVQEKIQILWL